jgi:vancomycin permeability regulator SanA
MTAAQTAQGTPSHPQPDDSGARRAQLRRYLIWAPVADLNLALDAFQIGPEGASVLPKPRTHAIVVLGAPVNGDGTPSPSILERTRRAAEIASAHPESLLVVTGGAVANRFSEAVIMEQQLISLGVDPTRVLREPNACTTLDNAAYTMALLENVWLKAALDHAELTPGADPKLESVWRKAVLDEAQLTIITEPFHAPRALRLFAAARSAYDVTPTLRFAATARAAQPQLPPHERLVRIGEMVLRDDVQALLLRCIEEKRRLSIGW